MNGYQIECRCRLRGELGKILHDMPRFARSRAVATLLASAAEGVDPSDLVEARYMLGANGLLLNQSLRFSLAENGPDRDLVVRIKAALELIEALVHGDQKS